MLRSDARLPTRGGCSWTSSGARETATSSLDCAQTLICAPDGHVWPIRDGIPRFVESQGYAGAFGFQWARHAQTQLDSHNGLTLSRDRWFAVTGWPERMEGERMLEAGSAPGGLRRSLRPRARTCVTFDYSTAIDQNRENNRRFPNVTFAQGGPDGAARCRGSFDRVFCLGRPAAPAESRRRASLAWRGS